MCSHFRPTAAVDGALDWLHANSILYEPADDSFRLLARNLDANFAIDRATGAIQWQMGGTDSDFALTGQPWDHGDYSSAGTAA